MERAKWGPGPWDTEPDHEQWYDEATGLPCMIHRGPVGALCGYVGVYPDHSWHGTDYAGCTKTPPCEDTRCQHSPDASVRVHGGITYAAECSGELCHVPREGEPEVWWFGFDCSHAGDYAPSLSRFTGDTYRTLDYVKEQCAALAAQLKDHP